MSALQQGVEFSALPSFQPPANLVETNWML